MAELKKEHRSKMWTVQEIRKLREIAPEKTVSELAKEFCTTIPVMQNCVRRYEIPHRRSHKRRSHWTPEELAALEKYYPNHTNPVVAKMLGKTSIAVVNMARSLQLTKNWTDKEDNILRMAKYGHLSTDELQKYFFPGRTASAIIQRQRTVTGKYKNLLLED